MLVELRIAFCTTIAFQFLCLVSLDVQEQGPGGAAYPCLHCFLYKAAAQRLPSEVSAMFGYDDDDQGSKVFFV